MKTKTSFAVCTTFAALLGLFATQMAPEVPVAQPPVKADLAGTVGIVDFTKVFENYSGAKKLQEGLKQKLDVWAKEIEAVGKEIQGLELEEKDEKDDERRADLRMRIQVLRYTFETKRELFTQREQRGYTEFLVTVHQRIEEAIGRVAEKAGLQLVLRRRLDVGKRPEDAVLAYRQRNVWAAHPNLDVTDAVTKMLEVMLKVNAGNAIEASGQPAGSNGG